MIPDTDTTIIGAGPYGLSIAAHLQHSGVDFRMLGTPLESWRRFMPEGMVLKSEPFASNLWDPARRYTLRHYYRHQGLHFQPVGSPVSLTGFLEYADWFCHETAVPWTDIKVHALRRSAGCFILSLADGQEVRSRRVILATGHMAFRQMPAELQSIDEPLVQHSARIDKLNSYANKTVVIIGGGQAALETAALLHEAGARVQVLIRRNRLEWNAPSVLRSPLARLLSPDAGIGSGWRSTAISELPRLFRACFAPAKRHRFVAGTYGPAGAWWLRKRVEGTIEVRLNTKVTAADATTTEVRLLLMSMEGPAEIRADHVIAATGYRVDIDQLQYLEPEIRANIVREVAGIPRLSSSFETSVKGLFMVGLASAPAFGPIMRFMYGAKHAAPIVASHLRATGDRTFGGRSATRAGLPA